MALRNHDSIGEETKRKVWQAKEELGYKLKSKPSGNIAFVLFDRGFDSPVYARFFQSIGEQTAQNEQLPLYLSLDSAAVRRGELPPVLQKRGVDGIIVSGLYDEELHLRLSALGIPLVCLGVYQLGARPWASCEVDIDGGLRLAISRFAELGHQRVGLLASSSDKREYGRRIRRAFEDSLEAFGLENGGVAYETDFGSDESSALQKGASSLLTPENRTTALIIEKASDPVYDECERRQLAIPGDVSIISLGRSAARMRPELTTVESNPNDIARAAYQKLLRQIKEPDEPLTREVFGMALDEGGTLGPRCKRAVERSR